MGVRVERSEDPYKGTWVEYRDHGWKFKDRTRLLSSVNDLETLKIILDYIENWNLKDVDGNPVPFDRSKGEALLDNLDDRYVIPWLIGSWFEARSRRIEVPLGPSPTSSAT